MSGLGSAPVAVVEAPDSVSHFLCGEGSRAAAAEVTHHIGADARCVYCRVTLSTLIEECGL